MWGRTNEPIESIESATDPGYNADGENGRVKNKCWSASETQKSLDTEFFLPGVGLIFRRPWWPLERKRLNYKSLDSDVFLPSVGILVYWPWFNLKLEPKQEPEPTSIVGSSSLLIERGCESPIFCPVPIYDSNWGPHHAELDWWKTWVFMMDESESESETENGDEDGDEDEERLINRAFRIVDMDSRDEAADNQRISSKWEFAIDVSQNKDEDEIANQGNSNWTFTMDDSESDNGDETVNRTNSKWDFAIDDSESEDEANQTSSNWVSRMDDSESESENGDETVNQTNSNWIFTMDDNDSDYSNYSDLPQAPPASPALTGLSTSWYVQGNPVLDPIAYISMFEEMDVEGLIRDPGFTFEDNDDLRIAPGRVTELDPHMPHDLCGCQWCKIHRKGGIQEPHDATIWCSCVPCEEVRLGKAKDDEESEDVAMTDFVSQFEDAYQSTRSRAEFFKTIKDRLRTGRP